MKSRRTAFFVDDETNTLHTLKLSNFMCRFLVVPNNEDFLAHLSMLVKIKKGIKEA